MYVVNIDHEEIDQVEYHSCMCEHDGIGLMNLLNVCVNAEER